MLQAPSAANATAAQNAAANDIGQQNAVSTRINADANAMQQQGTNPGLPTYNPRLDPTLTNTLLLIILTLQFQNAVLGLVAGGKTDTASTNLAQSWMTLAPASLFHDVCCAAHNGNAKIGRATV